MTDNERLFGPMRRAQLEVIEEAEALVRAIRAPGADLGLHALDDGTVVHIYRTPPAPRRPLDLTFPDSGVWEYRVLPPGRA